MREPGASSYTRFNTPGRGSRILRRDGLNLGRRFTLRRILPAFFGGSEDLVMSYATNRTLSANTHRLNLGTRNPLALVAGSHDGSTYRFRPHVASHPSMVDAVRAEVAGIAPSPSITRISPKPMGGGWRIMGRKRGSNLGSSVPSRSDSQPSSSGSDLQERFSRFGFSAFDLSTGALALRPTSDLRPSLRTDASTTSPTRASACAARAIRPAAPRSVAPSGRMVMKFLEPSASS